MAEAVTAAGAVDVTLAEAVSEYCSRSKRCNSDGNKIGRSDGWTSGCSCNDNSAVVAVAAVAVAVAVERALTNRDQGLYCKLRTTLFPLQFPCTQATH